MLSLLLLLIGLAIVLAQAYASAGRPLPVAEAIPVSALGLAWRPTREVKTRFGDKMLWLGFGDPAVFKRAYALARQPLRDAGYSWADDRTEGREGVWTPCCWEPVPSDEAAAERAIAAAEAAVVADDEATARAQERLRQREIEEAEANGPGRQADIDALRVSLDVLFWAWPKAKRELAIAVLQNPVGVGGFPYPDVAHMARQLVRQVDKAIAKVRERIAKDPAHDWLARAQEPGVLQAVHLGVKLLCGYDEDRASIRNDSGWGKSHSHVGHVLGALPTLSVIEGSQALSAVWRHRRQLRPELRAEIFGSAEA
ncbi:hypothetical protein [Methylobacterium sp. WL116]|uniref:hypothetical protein n=1 Tax=Methylobacterium sp. WL116 TaxID=2603889 RepID=UPI0011CB108E|nr:hypothetical protein [Methylobacterium sp. WL116]TXM91068.1 hypothetical protein FV223_16480 [Methylobacterium sp. WL116]